MAGLNIPTRWLEIPTVPSFHCKLLPSLALSKQAFSPLAESGSKRSPRFFRRVVLGPSRRFTAGLSPYDNSSWPAIKVTGGRFMVETLAPNLRSHYGAERAGWRARLPARTGRGSQTCPTTGRGRSQGGDAETRGDNADGRRRADERRRQWRETGGDNSDGRRRRRQRRSAVQVTGRRSRLVPSGICY